MEQRSISLEQAAVEYASTYLINYNQREASTSFKAGANWQKDQLKAQMQKVIDTLENDFAKQLVENVTNILFS